jgi:hypothetical protein
MGGFGGGCSSSSRGSGWAPSGPASPWECRAARSHQARPEEAQEASWGAAKEGTLALLACGRCTFWRAKTSERSE